MPIPQRFLLGAVVASLAGVGNMRAQVPETDSRESATFFGRVIAGPSGRPVRGAEVVFSALGRIAQSDTAGRFHISGLPPGRHGVVVRRIGYRPLAEQITLGAGESLEWLFTLSETVVLDTVPVIATRHLEEFERNRTMGLGSFLTRSDFEKQHERWFGEIVAQLSGASVVREGASAYVASRRALGTIGQCPNVGFEGRAPEPARRCQCYAQVYVDNVVWYVGLSGERVPDLNRIPVEMIDAVEYYAGPAQAPARYNRLNANCGVLVIHTRRSSR